MMRALLIVTVLSAAGGAVCAQPGNAAPTGMESCFQSARGADSICFNPAYDAVQRLDCLQKARTTLLQCLEHVPPEIATGPASSEKAAGKVTSEIPSGTAPAEFPTATVVPDKPPAAVSSDKSAAAASSDKPTAGVSADKPAADKPTAGVSADRPSADMPTAAVSSDKPAAPASPDKPTAAALPDKPTAGVSADEPAAGVSADKPSADMPTAAVSSDNPSAAVSPDKPAAAASPDLPARAVDIAPKPRDPNWIISETTSPVDYAPVMTAAIRLPFTVKHAPNTFAIRCRGGRTELLVRTEGTWRASRTREVQVDYQINDQPLVKLTWTVSPDGKTAIYRDDAVGLLQSLPDGARLKISVLDEPGPSHEATFQLTGLDVVREKIAVACKWPPAANKVSSEKH